MTENTAYEKSVQVSLMTIKLFRVLNNHHEYILSKQLLRSATSIGANIREAMSAYSKKEFLCKLQIALKEAHETDYWLLLLQRSCLIELNYEPYIAAVTELIKILTKSTKTIKEQLKTGN